ncbi:MAG: serine/threonine protein kinase [Synechococcaceae cyanobacterium SM2_3_1]|nr:serine/threonine protein kinase [Synechococcaceae cyanobacterium SM2_3_1]
MSFPLSPDPWTGLLLADRYCLEGLLGVGGMGRVYRAVDLQLSTATGQRYVAIKIMLASLIQDPEACSRFEREVEVALHLQDQWVVRVLDHGLTPIHWGPPPPAAHESAEVVLTEGWQGSPFLVMEYVEAPTLERILAEQGRLSVSRTLRLARHIGVALRAAHTGVMLEGQVVQVVHRDLNPSNIFVLEGSRGRETVKLGDFGLAKFVGEIDTGGLVTRGLLWGTLTYASPEQFRGGERIDGRSDIYSLGGILYEMLVGTNCFGLPEDTPTEQWLHAHLTRPPDPFPESLKIPEFVQQIILKCLQKDSDQRYASITDLDLDLQRAQQRLSTHRYTYPGSLTATG